MLSDCVCDCVQFYFPIAANAIFDTASSVVTVVTVVIVVVGVGCGVGEC